MNAYCLLGNLLNAYARAGYVWVRWIDDLAGWNTRMGDKLPKA